MPLFPLRACVRACCYHCRHKKIGSDSQGFARNDRNRDPTTGYHGFFEGHRTSVQTASGRHRIRSVVVFTGKTSLASRGGAESGALPRRPRPVDRQLGGAHGRGSAQDHGHRGGPIGLASGEVATIYREVLASRWGAGVASHSGASLEPAVARVAGVLADGCWEPCHQPLAAHCDQRLNWLWLLQWLAEPGAVARLWVKITLSPSAHRSGWRSRWRWRCHAVTTKAEEPQKIAVAEAPAGGNRYAGLTVCPSRFQLSTSGGGTEKLGQNDPAFARNRNLLKINWVKTTQLKERPQG